MLAFNIYPIIGNGEYLCGSARQATHGRHADEREVGPGIFPGKTVRPNQMFGIGISLTLTLTQPSEDAALFPQTWVCRQLREAT